MKDKIDFAISPRPVATIRLHGFPYDREVDGRRISCTDTLELLAQSSDYEGRLRRNIGRYDKELQPLFSLGFHGLDGLVKSRKPLTYDQAFSLLAFVSLSSNRALKDILVSQVKGHEMYHDVNTLLLQSVSLLQSMSTREAIVGLQPQEVAGMIAATLELDTICRPGIASADPIIGIGGMGGDKGVHVNGEVTKLFSVSTLSAIGLGSHGYVHKHHSYPNTSKVAGQSAIEAMGARSDFTTREQMQNVQRSSKILMSSCHTTRTIHTISHMLKGETINHVIGPGAVPHDEKDILSMFIGVNHNIHPATFIKALRILAEKGVARYTNSVAFCTVDNRKGVSTHILSDDRFYQDDDLKAAIVLDEVAPPPFVTLASFLIDGRVETAFIHAADFDPDLHNLDFHSLAVPNSQDAILEANEKVVRAEDPARVAYVAMSMALALFTRDFAQTKDAILDDNARKYLLGQCYKRAHESIMNGELAKKLDNYVNATNNL